MRSSIPIALAAVLVVILNPAYAADPSQDDSGKSAIQKDEMPMVTPSAPAPGDDDRTAKVIILGPDSLQDIPNPYNNPAPRLMSDAWAIRT